MADPIRYRPGVDGWIVEDRRELPGKDGGKFFHVAAWYGPDHGWGNTWGTIPDRSIRVWPTLDAAWRAMERAGMLGRKTATIRPVREAEQDRRDDVAARLDRYLTDGLDHPDAERIIAANREVLAELDAVLEARP